MAKAIWNGVVVAESEKTVVVEDTHYFPMDSIQRHYFKSSGTSTSCSTKGQASYYHLEVNGRINMDAAWYYPQPRAAVSQIKDHVAFWKGVEIEVDGQVQAPAPAETPPAPKAKSPAKASTPDKGGPEKTSAPAPVSTKTEAPPKPDPAPVAKTDEPDGGPGKTTPPVKTTATADQPKKTEPASTPTATSNDAGPTGGTTEKATPPAPAVAKADPGDGEQKPAKASVADGSDLNELRPTG